MEGLTGNNDSLTGYNLVSHNITLACLIEASVQKPGNVSPTHAFHSTKYEHYLAGSVAVGLTLGQLASAKEGRAVGELVYKTVGNVKKSHSGGNTHLGIILLLAPLAKAAGKQAGTSGELRSNLKVILNELDSNDAAWYFKSINLAEPGGLLPVSELDVRDESTLDDIQNKKIRVKDWMNISRETNSVSFEYVTDYQLSFETGLPFFNSLLTGNDPRSIDEAVLRLYLKFLSERPDSLVLGKFDEKTAGEVMESAGSLLELYESEDPHAKAQTQKFHEKLSAKKINPGMSADLTASTIFIALTLGLSI